MNGNFFLSIFRTKSTYISDSDDSDTEEIDVDKLAPLEIGPGEHKLQYNYCLWFSKKGPHRQPGLQIKATEVIFFSSLWWSPPLQMVMVCLTFIIFLLLLIPQEYSKSLHFVGRCASVEQWWSLYSHLVKPTALKPYRELHLFKSGIKPMWEDPGNAKGGKWVIRLRKPKIDRAWENVCMAMLGEQFLVGPEICGVVLSTKFPVRLTQGVNFF